MKTTFTSTLAFLPLLALVSAFEVSDVYKKTLGNSNCTDIHLTDGHVLHANCDNPGHGTFMDVDLDLNQCFANYLGTLNFTPNGHGGFGGSCSSCQIVDTKLTCQCSMGENRGTKYTEVELNDWNVIQVQEDSLSCDSHEGIEKRAIGKEARFFIA
ncbi:hypothetical protein K449DRAFT_424833 [Hypoxylon sp. EC38]|nr:hypothetical protein K449DRAFT_424833 [Hypoxylon sp. EC38]